MPGSVVSMKHYLIQALHVLNDEVFDSANILPTNGHLIPFEWKADANVVELTCRDVILYRGDEEFDSPDGSICYVTRGEGNKLIVSAVKILQEGITLPSELVDEYWVGDTLDLGKHGAQLMYRFGDPEIISDNMPDAISLLAESITYGVFHCLVTDIINTSHVWDD